MNKRFVAVGGISLLLICLLASCGFPGLVSTSTRLPQVSQTPQTTPLPPIRFPQDEGAHNDLTEWWYYTGHLDALAPDGGQHHYGFELVIFQALRSDLPPIYAAHFAVSDITRGQFHYDQRRLITASPPTPDGTSAQGIDIQVGDWTMRGINGHDQIAAQMKDYAIALDLKGLKPVSLHNGNGIIPFGLGAFSYYYSRTRMAVSGTILDHHQSLQVTGQAWMDHQWGNFLPFGDGGWDWFSLQLNNNAEIMLYIVRDAGGKVVSTYSEYIDARGQNILIPQSRVRVVVQDRWTSPGTGVSYPSGWRLELNDPRLQMTLLLTPQLKNQELITYNSTGNVYWEGAITIQGQSNREAIAGEGYVELTGYTK
ncbi:MAG TPA: lipocalin-like domain-containing protein [Ktedonobacteraceae bacterium]|nr:lipocalin-like domain-containing protein [Ktedonobacteraceae bacterium]